ncbi:sphinganine-1-phosphate aldolase, putative [Cryptococcus deneoformans JEC21]|uniref:sphinganine-1-phosphate aldolase n=1 Tax=Cryptococcus deneoformans (strain JEC21 / ATCC MYA-565) TaxID=214684 RepID=Q5KCC8_CRYD1|nr:sphinganine-1-phosphate aldolase, putative [Cryptococcus neoformans var. neoformans JEC21]AAW44943.1 sphinganine-1-phosphate aldolase, putative [Cryptococcus neoformans var. neoformans JEC21]
MPVFSTLINSTESYQRRFDQMARAVLVYWVLKYVLLDGFRHIKARGLCGTANEIRNKIKSLVVRIMLAFPSNRAKLNSELAKTRAELKEKLAPSQYPDGVRLTTVRTLPETGRGREWLESEWENLKKLEKADVDNGRVSGAVYHGGDELNAVINEAMAKFVVTNPLHPDVFPGVRKMESEIVSMCLNLFNGPNGAGTTTSGGTESILMSVKTHRDWARVTKGITRPEMVIPSSAHAAFWKASEYFNIKLHVIPVNQKTRKAEVAAMKRAINPNTIMIVGSAPNFPDGAIDPIPELGALAKRRNVGLHVDCCLGSFIMPFLEKAGFSEGIDPFDFRVPGVTSISCDTHKYAFCPKGTSVIMYRSSELRRFQYYVITDWAGGVYASPSMAGSRPGSVLAGAWAVLNHIGADGYTSSCRQIISAARYLTSSLRTLFPDDLYVLGDPKGPVVAFNSKTINIYAVGDVMSKKGWHLSALGGDGGLHMAFTRLSAKSVDKLIEDLGDALKEVKASPQGAGGDMVALYGLGQTSAGPHVVGKLAETFLDTLYE